MRFLYWPNGRVTGDDTLRTRDCWKLELKAPSRQSQYSNVFLWVDKNGDALMRMEGYDWNGQLAKRFEVVSAQKIEGRWFLKQMRIEEMQPGTSKVRARTSVEESRSRELLAKEGRFPNRPQKWRAGDRRSLFRPPTHVGTGVFQPNRVKTSFHEPDSFSISTAMLAFRSQCSRAKYTSGSLSNPIGGHITGIRRSARGALDRAHTQHSPIRMF